MTDGCLSLQGHSKHVSQNSVLGQGTLATRPNY